MKRGRRGAGNTLRVPRPRTQDRQTHLPAPAAALAPAGSGT